MNEPIILNDPALVAKTQEENPGAVVIVEELGIDHKKVFMPGRAQPHLVSLVPHVPRYTNK